MTLRCTKVFNEFYRSTSENIYGIVEAGIMDLKHQSNWSTERLEHMILLFFKKLYQLLLITDLIILILNSNRKLRLILLQQNDNTHWMPAWIIWNQNNIQMSFVFFCAILWTKKLKIYAKVKKFLLLHKFAKIQFRKADKTCLVRLTCSLFVLRGCFLMPRLALALAAK